jgi:protein-S-isoprenylcysteine O-methyltransferase Ste14
MERDGKAILFSGITLLATGFILLSGPIVSNTTPTLLVEIFSVLLILWACIARWVNKNKHPHLPPGYFFVTHGPYEIIRHPFYAGFLLIILSLVEDEFTFLRLLALLIIFFMILLKIIREESTMLHEVKEYQEYKKKTKAIIPLLL